MRSSYWSSDVCSSELGDLRGRGMSWRGFRATNRLLYAPASNPKNAAWDGIGAHNGDPRIRAFNMRMDAALPAGVDRKSVVKGTSVTVSADMGGRWPIKQ